MSFTLDIIKPEIGARIQLDRAALGDPETGQKLRQALDRHTVLVFPEINLTDEEQLLLTDMLGARVNVSSASGRQGASEVYKVTLGAESSVEKEYVYGTWFWHMDGLTVDIPPPKATVLSARHLSAIGGQTEFASTKSAYEALSDEDKAVYGALQVLHTASASVRELTTPDALTERQRALRRVHPLVRTQPGGIQSMLIGWTADMIIGKSLAESRATLARLMEWAAQPDFTYRHEWKIGDCAVWDNTCAMHRVVPYAEDSGRMMHRTAVAGAEAAA